jgi:hypothetical protein
MKGINDGVVRHNDDLGINLVNNFGYLTLEYFDSEDDSFEALTLAESNGSTYSDAEIEDIYNNCCNIDGYLDALVNMKLSENGIKIKKDIRKDYVA